MSGYCGLGCGKQIGLTILNLIFMSNVVMFDRWEQKGMNSFSIHYQEWIATKKLNPKIFQRKLQ